MVKKSNGLVKQSSDTFFGFFGNIPTDKKGNLKKVKKQYFGDPQKGLYNSDLAKVIKDPANNKGFKSLAGYTINIINRVR